MTGQTGHSLIVKEVSLGDIRIFEIPIDADTSRGIDVQATMVSCKATSHAGILIIGIGAGETGGIAGLAGLIDNGINIIEIYCIILTDTRAVDQVAVSA